MEAPLSVFGAMRGSVCRRCLQRYGLLSSKPTSPVQPPSAARVRAVSSTASRHQQAIEVDPADRPRWQRTPPAMVAPVRVRPRPQGEYKVNDDPQKLDQFYADFLGGRRSELQLSEEVRWLAVTHKSFDHGRRGFNDRLAFLGKRIIDLQASLALLRAYPKQRAALPEVDIYDRPIYHDPHLTNLSQLTEQNKSAVVDKRRLAQLAVSYGAQDVIRWKPRLADNLHGSGIDSVLAQTLFAVVGAISLEMGGMVATHVVRERILKPLGL